MAEFIIRLKDRVEVLRWNKEFLSPFMEEQPILVGTKYNSMAEQFEDIFQIEFIYNGDGSVGITGTKDALHV